MEGVTTERPTANVSQNVPTNPSANAPGGVSANIVSPNMTGAPLGTWTPKLSPPSGPVPQGVSNIAQQYASAQPGISQPTGHAYERRMGSPASSSDKSEIDISEVKQQIWWNDNVEVKETFERGDASAPEFVDIKRNNPSFNKRGELIAASAEKPSSSSEEPIVSWTKLDETKWRKATVRPDFNTNKYDGEGTIRVGDSIEKDMNARGSAFSDAEKI